jgi:DNA polymerase-3 subunit gamma/tau
MDFQASARKWRPQKFSELVGQEHIVRTLRNAIELDRIAHAYLFSGTRGVGKTTIARLLAKALNCAKGPIADPCDECDFCIEIREGNSVDVQEIDGASNNGVGEVRDLIENIQYAASACKFKVYIIDEVHMLSKAAFNALLKTLEEPPAGVVFIFATTELLKIPETILSRCQCFEFKPLASKQIKTQLQLITERDGIEIDSQSLEEIAKNGSGSMRDSQSLLDQVVAFCGKKIDSGSVEDVLGIAGPQALETFMNLMADKNPTLLDNIQTIVDQGKNLQYFCRDLIAYIRNLLLVKILDKPETILDTSNEQLKILQDQAGKFDQDELQQMFNILARTEDQMKRSSLPRMVFEMAVIRLMDVRPFQKIDDLIQKINTMEPEPQPAIAQPRQAPQTAPTSAPMEIPAENHNEAPAQPAEQKNPDATGTWETVRAEIQASKRSFDHFFANCQLIFFDKTKLQIGFDEPYTVGLLQKEENLQYVKDAVKKICGIDDINVVLEYVEKGTAKTAQPDPQPNNEEKKTLKSYDKNPSEDEILKDALDIFGGMVIN